MRGRGLKHPPPQLSAAAHLVAPYAGAWLLQMLVVSIPGYYVLFAAAEVQYVADSRGEIWRTMIVEADFNSFACDIDAGLFHNAYFLGNNPRSQELCHCNSSGLRQETPANKAAQ